MNRQYWVDIFRYLLLLVVLSLIIGCRTISEDISAEYYNIGNAYYDVSDFDKAIEYYNRALLEDSTIENSIRFNLAVAYSESGRVDEGLRHFNFLLEQDSENLKVLQSVAYAYYLIGNEEKSLEIYNRILDIFEFDKTALFNKALILFDDDIEEAEDLLKKLYSIDKSTEVVLLLGTLYEDREDWDSLVLLYEMALVQDERNVEILDALAIYYKRVEQYNKSISYLEEILIYENPENLSSFYFRKAEIELLNLNDFASGLQSLSLALEEGFNDAQKIKALAQDERLGNSSEVEKLLEGSNLFN